MYKDGKVKKIQPYFLFNLVERAYDTAKFAYLLHGATTFKRLAEMFAKASEKYENFLGKVVTSHGYPYWFRDRIQDIENGPYTATSLNRFK